MVRIFSRVWKSDGNEDPEASRQFELQKQGLQRYYELVDKQLRQENPMQEIRRKLGKQEEPVEPDENDFPAERAVLLAEADQWLMDAYLKQDSKLKQTIVFSVLERPARERMLIYYMMEHGNQTAMRPSFISLSQMNYKPNLSMLAKQKLKLSKLREIYEQVYTVRDTVKLWNEAAKQQEARKEDLEALEPNIQVLNKMAELEKLAETYKKYSQKSKLSKKKRSLEEKMREKVTELGQSVELLLADRRTVLAQGTQENETFEALKDTNKQVKEEGIDKKLVAAAAGVTVGAVTAGAGVYKVVHAGIEKRKGKQAAQDLRSLGNAEIRQIYQAGEEPLLEEHRAEYREIETREHLIKIQERIANRKQITAGCQVISGICTTAAGACTLTGNAAFASLLGFAGFLSTGVGMAITVIKKVKESRAAVDEFLGLEKLAEQQETELKKKKGRLSGSEKKEIRNRLRQELMEQLGFGSEKALHSFVMKHYADYIYAKIQPLLNDPARKLDEARPDEKAYLELVGSLGLDIRKKVDAVEEKNRKAGLPTSEMIYQKLMS